nr:CopG family transcriptional regulator [Macrococcus sp. 19Msa1099]QYA34222.1 ribbon-helix-helix domain-containing protein [Macrococcus sp. 19Msa1099]QYA39031.1 ribbon-helix-helix domain-containing protein [Macrococcus caseolyticus]QYA77757.1 ribbon-helix-helix domain-containing protein [Macrococcus caseolyticus]
MMKRLQITLKDDVAKKLEILSVELGVSKSALITLALNEYLLNKRL